MIADEELKVEGIKVLVAALGDVQAGRFVALMLRSPFEYTNWQQKIWPETSVRDLSEDAMRLRATSSPRS